MDTELKRKWVEALRSGKYEQGKTELRHEDKFCCLGVLRDIIRPGVKVRSEILLDCYRDKAGLDQEDAYDLAGLNDCDGKSFAEIADYIEANL